MKSTSTLAIRELPQHGLSRRVRLCIGAVALLAVLLPGAAAYAGPGDPASAAGLDAGRKVYLPELRGTAASGQSTTSGHVYWGVAMEGVPWDMNKLASWENLVGKKVSIVHFWQFWNQGGSAQRFQPTLMNSIRSHGSIPMISWPSERMGGGANQSEYQLGDIISGAYDSYIRQYATDAKAWGKPFFLRWGHEMNGNWGYNWQESQNGNQRGQFVQAWRHIHDLFTSVGATNATWVWCPNIEFSASSWPSFSSLYPGDNYVDWTCLDGYNWGSNFPEKNGWIGFKDLYRYSYNVLGQVAPNKPIMIGEFASSEVSPAGASKGSWIADALSTQLPQAFPRIKAHLWFNNRFDNVDWRVESSSAATAAYKTGIASSYHLDAQFGSLNAAPVPAP